MKKMNENILAVLRGVDDPEVGINIVDLGLVYSAECTAKRIAVEMTATSRSCPLGEHMIEQARDLLSQAFPDAEGVDVQLVWSPAWGPERMSDDARRILFAE